MIGAPVYFFIVFTSEVKRVLFVRQDVLNLIKRLGSKSGGPSL